MARRSGAVRTSRRERGASPADATPGIVRSLPIVELRSLSKLRLRRSRSDRIVAGVSGGIGRQLGIDPVVLRLAFVVLAAGGGFGVLLYLVCWLVGTEAEDPGPVVDSNNPVSLNPVMLHTTKSREKDKYGINVMKTMSDKEKDIYAKLEKPVTVSFTNVPLYKAVDDLRAMQGMNIHLDQAALASDHSWSPVSNAPETTIKMSNAARGDVTAVSAIRAASPSDSTCLKNSAKRPTATPEQRLKDRGETSALGNASNRTNRSQDEHLVCYLNTRATR